MVQRMDEIKGWIDRILFSPSHEGGTQTHEKLFYLAQQQLVPVLLRSALSDSDSLHLIASKSYKHYNNFDKIVLVSCAELAYDLRLHVWWPNGQKITRENVHDHKWNFSSVVLKGGYSFEEYEPSAIGVDMYEYRYSTRVGVVRYRMPFIRHTKLNRVSTGRRIEGHAYTLNHDVLHRVICHTQEPTVTLVVRGRTMKEHARVFSDVPNENSLSIASPVFSVPELREKFAQLLRLF